MTDLTFGLATAADGCMRLGHQVLETYRAYRDADTSISDRITIIEVQWAKLETQLGLLTKISRHLSPSVADVQFRMLQKLHDKLIQVTGQIDFPDSKYRRKLKYALSRDKLDELVADLEAWQQRFDPTWFIMTLIGNSLIDAELWEQQKTVGSPSFEATPLHNLLAIRQAIRPENVQPQTAKRINMSINISSNDFKSAVYTPIPFCSIQTVQRPGSTKLLVSDRIQGFGPNNVEISQMKTLTENLARRLKQVDFEKFNLLRCYGIVKHHDPDGKLSKMDMLYVSPPGSFRPTSLRQLLLKQKPVSASALVRIAKQLVQSISYIHACDFVHKNIRPESILIFPGKSSTVGSCYLAGFNQFRHNDFQTQLKGDPRWHPNVYRHPQRQGCLVQERYLMQHDIYSLGVCLLEIGIWKSFVWYSSDGPDVSPVPGLALGIRPSNKDFETVASALRLQTKEHLVGLAKTELPPRLGDIYTGIVVACLTCLDPGNEIFGNEQNFQDEDGILIGLRFAEKILQRIQDISI